MPLKLLNKYLFKSKAPALFLVLFSLLSIQSLKANNTASSRSVVLTAEGTDTVFVQISENLELNNSRPNPILQMFKVKQRKNKRITAAILAFPFPFGIVGLHRIYLGTSPHVPVVYIGTLGGVLGILPFIDFCVLILDKDFDRYIENKKVFMWVN